MESFCGLENWISKNTQCLQYKTPTKVQEKIIPHILNNKGNLIGISKTGTGKTAAFCLPILDELAKDPSSVFAIIIEPTRELALQVVEKLNVYSVGFNLRVSMIIGGEDYINQMLDLDKLPHIIVSTPGRLAELLVEDKINLIENVKYLVLDEFDQLFNDTMIGKIEYIAGKIKNNESRVNLLFSATYSNETLPLNEIKSRIPIGLCSDNNSEMVSNNILNDYTVYYFDDIDVVGTGNKTSDTLLEQYVTVPALLKELYLAYLLKTTCKLKNKSVIIFVQTCVVCQYLSEILQMLSFKVSAIHSKIPQKLRFSELKKFKNNETRILVSTDLACRGLDIQQVDYVINYDIPRNPVDYVHRVGRCGRSFENGGGLSISFITPVDVEMILAVEKYTNKKLTELEINEDEAMKELSIISKCKKMIRVKLNNNKRLNKKNNIN